MTPAWQAQNLPDLFEQATALKLRLQAEIRKDEAVGIGEYFYLSDKAYQIILAALVKVQIDTRRIDDIS